MSELSPSTIASIEHVATVHQSVGRQIAAIEQTRTAVAAHEHGDRQVAAIKEAHTVVEQSESLPYDLIDVLRSGREQPTVTAIEHQILLDGLRLEHARAIGRISAILSHGEARGRGRLARHLAFKTSNTVEAAVAILECAERSATDD